MGRDMKKVGARARPWARPHPMDSFSRHRCSNREAKESIWITIAVDFERSLLGGVVRKRCGGTCWWDTPRSTRANTEWERHRGFRHDFIPHGTKALDHVITPHTNTLEKVTTHDTKRPFKMRAPRKY